MSVFPVTLRTFCVRTITEIIDNVYADVEQILEKRIEHRLCGRIIVTPKNETTEEINEKKILLPNAEHINLWTRLLMEMKPFTIPQKSFLIPLRLQEYLHMPTKIKNRLSDNVASKSQTTITSQRNKTAHQASSLQYVMEATGLWTGPATGVNQY